MPVSSTYKDGILNLTFKVIEYEIIQHNVVCSFRTRIGDYFLDVRSRVVEFSVI